MIAVRRLIAPILVAQLLTATLFTAHTAWAGSLSHGDDPAGGASSTTVVMRVKNATIPWLFPPPEGLSDKCPDIPAGLNINPDDLSSNRNKRAVINTEPDGSKQIILTDSVNGTARDKLGNTYNFVYSNKATLNYDGTTVNVRMVDSFQLKGGEVNTNVGFDWSWAYPATGVTVTLGALDIVVEPFPFATADGVNEDPNIVPGSWVKTSTRGNPALCDPL